MKNEKVSILIVEDDQPIRDMYAFKLEMEGFTVTKATNGKEGLDEAFRNSFQLILLDIKMPLMDGVQMLTQLRSSDLGKSVRVIILTNLNRLEAPKELQFLSVSRYVVKAHTTPSQLIEIVKEVVR